MTLTRGIKIDIVDREFRAEVEFTYHLSRNGSQMEPQDD